MSGYPKHHDVQLQRETEARLEREGQERARQEAIRRQQAQERERKRRLDELRSKSLVQSTQFESQLTAAAGSVYQGDYVQIEKKYRQNLDSIRTSPNEGGIRRAASAIADLTSDIVEASSRKRRDDAERQRLAAIELQKVQLGEIERSLNSIPQDDRLKFDRSGSDDLGVTVRSLHSLIAQGNPSPVSTPLDRAKNSLQRHLAAVRDGKADWQRRKDAAEDALGELDAVAVGIGSDETVLRWFADLGEELSMLVRAGRNACELERFDRPVELLSQGRDRVSECLRQASEAQRKADQSRYIADSIAATLRDMNFEVSAVRREHESHPASALLISAASVAGKSIRVSVPVEGQVLYVVDGYPHESASTNDGGQSAACDEAEGVLNQMRAQLRSEYGVDSGELDWEGKNPNRLLRSADDLPSGHGASSARGGH